MAVPATLERSIEDNMTSEDIEVTIAKDGIQFLMSMLTNLYERPALAVVREYCTNAIDAHLEAGEDRPVEVTMPTAFNQSLVIRDYGVGMSFEDIRDTYSKYVASTKRQDNTQAGMFGIGAKSALAYGDMFTVVSIKDGMRTECLVQRTGQGSAVIKVVGRSSTNEQRGTVIQVPAYKVADFNSAADDFFPYVQKGKFLVNGEDRGETFDGVQINDRLYALPFSTSYYDKGNWSYIVMGNVPYKVKTQNAAFLKYVEPGTFEPTPPREGLEQRADFDNKIAEIINEARSGILSAVQQQVDGVSTTEELSKYIVDNYRMLSDWKVTGRIRYNGKTLNTQIVSDNYVVVSSSSSHKPASQNITVLESLELAHVYGHDVTDEDDITSYACGKAYWHRSKCRRLAGRYSIRRVVLWFNGAEPDYCLDEAKIHWNDAGRKSPSGSSAGAGSYTSRSRVKAGDDWKVPTRKPSYGRRDSNNTPSFGKRDVEVVDYHDYTGERDLVYFSPTELTSEAYIALIRLLMADYDVFVVIKNRNQFAKTKRDNPEAIHFKDYIKDYADTVHDRHGAKAFLQVTNNSGKYGNISCDLIDALRTYEDAHASASGAALLFVRSESSRALTAQVEYDKLKKQITERYPLLRHCSVYSSKDELAEFQEYVNMIDERK